MWGYTVVRKYRNIVAVRRRFHSSVGDGVEAGWGIMVEVRKQNTATEWGNINRGNVEAVWSQCKGSVVAWWRQDGSTME